MRKAREIGAEARPGDSAAPGSQRRGPGTLPSLAKPSLPHQKDDINTYLTQNVKKASVSCGLSTHGSFSSLTYFSLLCIMKRFPRTFDRRLWLQDREPRSDPLKKEIPLKDTEHRGACPRVRDLRNGLRPGKGCHCGEGVVCLWAPLEMLLLRVCCLLLQQRLSLLLGPCG